MDQATAMERLLEARQRITELESRIENATRQIAVADRHAREAKADADKIASVWDIQNGLIHDALNAASAS